MYVQQVHNEDKCTVITHTAPHGSLAILLESTFRVSAVALSVSTVKHGSFLFAYFLEQINEKTKKQLENCASWGCMLYILQLLTNEIN